MHLKEKSNCFPILEYYVASLVRFPEFKTQSSSHPLLNKNIEISRYITYLGLIIWGIFFQIRQKKKVYWHNTYFQSGSFKGGAIQLIDQILRQYIAMSKVKPPPEHPLSALSICSMLNSTTYLYILLTTSLKVCNTLY